MSDQSTPGYWSVTPAHVRYCKNIEMGAKLLYGELTALAHREGYCWASNAHFAELYDVDVRTVQRWLSSLKEEGFIEIELVKEGIHSTRRIWISQEIKEMFTKRQKCHPPMTSVSPPHDKNVIPPRQKCHTNNKVKISSKEDIKNSICPTSSSIPSASPPSSADAEEVFDFFLTHLRKRQPNFKEPNKEKWLIPIERMLRIDKRPLDEIKNLMAWVTQDDFWAKNCKSPDKLREKYDQLLDSMGSTEKKERVEANRRWAIQQKALYPKQLANLTWDSKFARNDPMGKDVPFDIYDFETKFYAIFGAKYE